jgi:hypothetical protein
MPLLLEAALNIT